MPKLTLAQDVEADELLSKEPLALLIGMVLDQQVPLEWAFSGPAELKRRLGGKLDAQAIASMDPEEFANVFSQKPALHRYPGSMAKRVHELCRVVADEYGGKAERLWGGVKSGSELLDRVKDLPGFGDHKAKIFVALLGKQLDVRPPGWEEVSGPFSEPGSFRSVADIVDAESLLQVRSFKQQMKHQMKGQKAGTGRPGKRTSSRRT